jgi:hypothetical protein
VSRCIDCFPSYNQIYTLVYHYDFFHSWDWVRLLFGAAERLLVSYPKPFALEETVRVQTISEKEIQSWALGVRYFRSRNSPSFGFFSRFLRANSPLPRWCFFENTKSITEKFTSPSHEFRHHRRADISSRS